MKSIIIVFISIFSLLNDAHSQNPTQEDIKKDIKEIVLSGRSAGIGTGVLKGDSIIFNHSQGYSNLNTKTPFTEKTITRLASIAKPMTAAAIMQLVEKGQVKLSDPISKFIPTLKNKKLRDATVQNLLEQSAGIKAYKNKKEAHNRTHYPTLLNAANVFMERKLLFDPSTGFRYSSYNYTLLGIVIEKSSGLTYEEYMQENIFDKAGMTSTSIEVVMDYPEGKSRIFRRDKPHQFQTVDDNSLSDRIPGGGIQSSVKDVLLFAKAIVNNTLISEESLKTISTDSGYKKEGNPYGMGWFIYGHGDNGSVIGHSGGQLGCSSFLFVLPEKKIASVVLANTSGVDEVIKIANDLFIQAVKENN